MNPNTAGITTWRKLLMRRSCAREGCGEGASWQPRTTATDQPTPAHAPQPRAPPPHPGRGRRPRPPDSGYPLAPAHGRRGPRRRAGSPRGDATLLALRGWGRRRGCRRRTGRPLDAHAVGRLLGRLGALLRCHAGTSPSSAELRRLTIQRHTDDGDPGGARCGRTLALPPPPEPADSLNPDKGPAPPCRPGRIVRIAREPISAQEGADMARKRPPSPPNGLGTQGRALWRQVLADFDLGIDELAVLREAARVADTSEALQAVLDRDGLTVAGSKGQPRNHPGLAELRQQRRVLANAGKLAGGMRPAASASRTTIGAPTPNGPSLRSRQTWLGVPTSTRGGARVTVQAYAEGWRVAQIHRATTAAQVETHLRRHVYPAFGDRALGSVRPFEVQAWVRGLEQHLAPSTIRVVYSFVADIFRAAVRDRLLVASPCVDVRLPRPEPKRVEPLATERVEALIAAMGERYRALVVLAAGTGLRHGEALGLEVDAVDFLRRTLQVRQQLVTMPGQPPYLAPPKTPASHRTIPLPQVVVDALAAHLAAFPAARVEILDAT